MAALVANTPVKIAPTVPPTPCTEKVSSESSNLNLARKLTAVKQHTAAIEPIKSAPIGVTKPAAGVMPTSPARNPLAIPTAVGLPRNTHSTNSHVKPPDEVATVVATNATAAIGPALRALPALNPNQPNHNNPIPKST